MSWQSLPSASTEPLHFLTPAPAQLEVAGTEAHHPLPGGIVNSCWKNFCPYLMTTTLTCNHTTFLLFIHSLSQVTFKPSLLYSTSFLTCSHLVAWLQILLRKFWQSEDNSSTWPLTPTDSTFVHRLSSRSCALAGRPARCLSTGSACFLLHIFRAKVTVPFLLHALGSSFQYSTKNYLVKDPSNLCS